MYDENLKGESVLTELGARQVTTKAEITLGPNGTLAIPYSRDDLKVSEARRGVSAMRETRTGLEEKRNEVVNLLMTDRPGSCSSRQRVPRDN